VASKPLCPPLLLDKICRGAVIPFIGAGFSKNVGDHYRTFEELAEKLAEELKPTELGPKVDPKESPLTITNAFAEARGLPALHDTICDIWLPRKDNPEACHELFTSLPWRRCYTTNYDLLLERAGEERLYVTVATDQEYSQYKYTSHVMVFKLCGDKNHRTMMRATKSRLKPEVLEEELHEIYEDLTAHLSRVSFLYLGYSLRDEFLKFALNWARVQAAKEGRDLNTLPESYIVVFKAPSEEEKEFLKANNLVSIVLSKDKKTAVVEEFLKEIGTTYVTRARKDNLDRTQLLHDLEGEKDRVPEYESIQQAAKTVPVFHVGGTKAEDTVQKVVLPILNYFHIHPEIYKFNGQDDVEEKSNRIDILLSKTFCAIFVFDCASEAMEVLAQRALHNRCRLIVLCEDDSHLGFYTSGLRSQTFRHSNLRGYVEEQLNFALVETLFARGSELLGMGDTAMTVAYAWIACEFVIRREFGIEFREDKSKQLFISKLISQLIKRRREISDKIPPDDDDIDCSRQIRNKVQHGKYKPTHEEAQHTLKTTRQLAHYLNIHNLVPDEVQGLTVPREEKVDVGS
jgi:hypothetical protein